MQTFIPLGPSRTNAKLRRLDWLVQVSAPYLIPVMNSKISYRLGSFPPNVTLGMFKAGSFRRGINSTSRASNTLASPGAKSIFATEDWRHRIQITECH